MSGSGGGGGSRLGTAATASRSSAPAPLRIAAPPPPRPPSPPDGAPSPAPPLAVSLPPNPSRPRSPAPSVPHSTEEEEPRTTAMDMEEEDQASRKEKGQNSQKKVVEPSKKKKFVVVDLKSIWGRAAKKQKSIVDSNNLSEYQATRKDPEPEPVHSPEPEEIGCRRPCDVANAEIEPEVANESTEVSKPLDANASTEVSKPQDASSESEDDDWLEDVDEDVGLLPHDPGKRIAIANYNVNQQDTVRMKYIALGPCRPPLDQFPQRQCGGKRRFIHSWCDKYSWLEYSEEKDAAFCFVCYLFKDRTNYVGGDSFVNEGFRQWNHLDRFDKHVGSVSSAHNLAKEKYDMFIRPKTAIGENLRKLSKHDKAVYKARLTYSLKCLRFLLRQGLACRGHDETEESLDRGNFLELLNWLAENFKEVNEVVLKNAPKNCKMTSPRIQKQLIECCAKQTTKLLKEDLGDEFFSILADESSDVYQNEQLALCLRYVDKKGSVVERFLGVVHVENTTALTLRDAIKNLLMQQSLSLSRVRGQGYDGASNMKGEVNGLKRLIMNESPSAYYVHCFAHQLQLTLVAVAKENSDCVWFFEQLGYLLNVIGISCKKHQMLRVAQAQEIVEALELGDIESGQGLNQEMGLGRPGDTRWGSHYKTVQHILILYRSIQKVLFQVGTDRSQSTEAIKAQTALQSFESFEFVFMAHLLNTVLGYTDDLNTALQRRDQDIVNAIELIYLTKLQFEMLRQDDGWENFLKEVTSFCVKNKVKVPNMDDNYKPVGRSARFFGKVQNLHRFKVEMFLSVIDRQLRELNDRFDEVNTDLLLCMASFNPINSFGSFDMENLVKLAKFYPNDFSASDMMHLPIQLDRFIIDMRRDDRFREVKNIAELSVMLVDTNKHINYPLVYKLLKLVLVLPVATASVERVFSAMNHVKNKLRNRMGDEYLNDCSVTFLERDFFLQVPDDDIIRQFQRMESRRVKLKL